MFTVTPPTPKTAPPPRTYGSIEFTVSQAIKALLAIEARNGPIADARKQLALLDENIPDLRKCSTEKYGEIAGHLVGSLTTLRDSLQPPEDRPMRASEASTDTARLICALDALIELASRRALPAFRQVYAATVLEVIAA